MAASGGTRGPSRGSTWSAPRGVRSDVDGRERGERVSAVDGDASDRTAAGSEPREGEPIQQRWRVSAVARVPRTWSASRSDRGRTASPIRRRCARDELPRSIQRSPHGLGASLSERARDPTPRTSPSRAPNDPRPVRSQTNVSNRSWLTITRVRIQSESKS